jgi:predicted  nucleic acid-binding Zn-ribbon protein
MYASYNSEVELVLHGKNIHSARATDTAFGTIRSLESTVRCFEERAERLELDINDANKRVKELGVKVGAKFEHEDRYQDLTRRQSEIEEKANLTKNRTPSQMDVTATDESENNSPRQI